MNDRKKKYHVDIWEQDRINDTPIENVKEGTLKEVINFYGLYEPDVERFEIKEVAEGSGWREDPESIYGPVCAVTHEQVIAGRKMAIEIGAVWMPIVDPAPGKEEIEMEKARKYVRQFISDDDMKEIKRQSLHTFICQVSALDYVDKIDLVIAPLKEYCSSNGKPEEWYKDRKTLEKILRNL